MNRRMGPSGIVFLNKMKALPEPDMSAVAARLITQEELARHASPQDGWMAYKGLVYDVTAYCQDHPGGVSCMHSFLGKDITQITYSVHAWIDVHRAIQKLVIGTLVPAEDFPAPARNPFAK